MTLCRADCNGYSTRCLTALNKKDTVDQDTDEIMDYDLNCEEEAVEKVITKARRTPFVN